MKCTSYYEFKFRSLECCCVEDLLLTLTVFREYLIIDYCILLWPTLPAFILSIGTVNLN